MSTVTVSCKTPNGILMQVNNVDLKINGWNSNDNVIISPLEKVGITYDVPEAFWKAWLQQHKDHPLHTNGLIFASASESKAKAEARERKGVKSGLEALDPNAKKEGVEKAEVL